MAAFTFTDNTYGTIASGITDADLSITLTTGHGVRFPAVSGTILPATLVNSSNVVEQIHITAHTASSDTITITRAANGTTAKAWSAGDRIEVRLTSEFLNIAALLFGSTDAVAAFSLLPSVTTLTIGAGASVALNIGNASAAAAFPGGISIPTGKTLSGAGSINISGTMAVSGQPAFLAVPASDQVDIAASVSTTIVFGTEIFDQASNFASNTFTAPVTGRYQLNANIGLLLIDTAASYYLITIVTSNRTYYDYLDPTRFSADINYFTFNLSVLADMDAGDTAVVKFYQAGGTAQTDVRTISSFSGFLAC